MSSQDGGVSGEVVEVVHDDSHEQVEHQEAAEEDKGDKEEVGDVAAAHLVWLQQLPRGGVPLDSSGITDLPCSTSQHDVRPGLTSSTSKIFVENRKLFYRQQNTMKHSELIGV